MTNPINPINKQIELKQKNLDKLIELKEKQIFEQQAFNKIHFTDENIQDYEYFENNIFTKCPMILLENGDLKYYSFKKNNYFLFKNNQEIYNVLYSLFRFTGSNIKSLNEVISKGLKAHALTFRAKHVKELNVNEIAFKDCIFNINTLQIQQNTPEIYASNQIPINFKDVVNFNEEQLATPIIDNYLSDWLVSKDDNKTEEQKEKEIKQVTCIKEMIGFMFHREFSLQKIFMFVGNGSNGKSTLINLIQTMLGEENYSTILLEQLVNDNDYSRACLFEKLVNFGADVSSKQIVNTNKFNLLTGDKVRAREIYKPSFEFKSYAKHIFSCNTLPSVKDNTDGYHRRWVIITFPNNFEGTEIINQNKKTINKSDFDIIESCKPEFAKFIFKCILAYRNNTLKNRYFTGELNLREKKKLYRDLSNPIDYFIQENLEFLDEEYFANDYSMHTAIYKSNLDNAINNYLQKINKTHMIQSKGYTKYIKPYLGDDNSRILVNRSYKNKEGNLTSKTYYNGVRFKTILCKLYDPEINKFKVIYLFGDIDYNEGKYNIQDMLNIFKIYKEDELKILIQKLKKQGVINEIKSGIYRFENINNKRDDVNEL